VDQFVLAPSATTTDRLSERVETLVFAGPSAALVWDNALFGFTGPIAGRRYRVEVARYFGDVELNEVAVDLRNYWNLGGQHALTSRLLGIWRSGSSSDQFRVYWGGPYFLRGYDGTSFGREECLESAKRVVAEFVTGCPVRDQLIGSSLALLSTELRFPIFNFLDLGVVPLGLPPLDGALFFDVGAAFNSVGELVWRREVQEDPFTVRKPLASYGAGLRLNIFYAVVRLDYAVPLDRPDHGGGIWSLSFGPTF
jgi:outer membrane protein assembly factor BamA